MHSLAGSSTSRTFLGFTAASGTFLPPQQGAAKPISPPPEKHKTSSYALHRARVPMKTYHFTNLALRRCLDPLHSDTVAPLGRINNNLRFIENFCSFMEKNWLCGRRWERSYGLPRPARNRSGFLPCRPRGACRNSKKSVHFFSLKCQIFFIKCRKISLKWQVCGAFFAKVASMLRFFR